MKQNNENQEAGLAGHHICLEPGATLTPPRRPAHTRERTMISDDAKQLAESMGLTILPIDGDIVQATNNDGDILIDCTVGDFSAVLGLFADGFAAGIKTATARAVAAIDRAEGSES